MFLYLSNELLQVHEGKWKDICKPQPLSSFANQPVLKKFGWGTAKKYLLF